MNLSVVDLFALLIYLACPASTSMTILRLILKMLLIVLWWMNKLLNFTPCVWLSNPWMFTISLLVCSEEKLYVTLRSSTFSVRNVVSCFLLYTEFIILIFNFPCFLRKLSTTTTNHHPHLINPARICNTNYRSSKILCIPREVNMCPPLSSVLSPRTLLQLL